jgi:hypothetical protein
MRGILIFSVILLFKKKLRPGEFTTPRRELLKPRPAATAKNRPGVIVFPKKKKKLKREKILPTRVTLLLKHGQNCFFSISSFFFTSAAAQTFLPPHKPNFHHSLKGNTHKFKFFLFSHKHLF